MIAHFSPACRAALEKIKEFIRSNVCTVALDERVFMLAGLPSADIDDGIAEFCGALSECFMSEAMPEQFRSGFVIAAAEMVRERIDELNLNGTGRA